MRRAWYMLCRLGLAAGLAFLSGCAGEMAAYDWKMPLKEPAVLEKYQWVLVNVQVQEGFSLPEPTRERLASRISECFRSVPGRRLIPVSVEGTGEGILNAQVLITRYDDGVVFARSAFREPDSMYIVGEVTLSDGKSREKLAVFDVSQTYDRSRTFGGLTTIDELEPQFAQGVVAGITQQPQ